MNKLVLIAAGLMALTSVAHSYGGGIDVHQPIQNELVSEELKAFAAVIWHSISVWLILFTGALAWLSRVPNMALGRLMSLVQLGLATIFIFYGLTRLGTVWIMPQWTVFLLIPALTEWGSRQQRGAA